MRIRYLPSLIVLLAALGGYCVQLNKDTASAQQGAKKEPAAKQSAAVEKVIVPFVTKHCVQCHGAKKKNAGLALHIYTDEKSILKDRKKWHEVVRMVHSGEMPKEKQPRPD